MARLVARATARVEAAGLADRVSVRMVSPGRFPFEDCAFDVVFSKDSIVHIPDKRVQARLSGAGSAENGGTIPDHGSGGAVPPRRSITLPGWPFPATERAEGFTPWSAPAVLND